MCSNELNFHVQNISDSVLENGNLAFKVLSKFHLITLHLQLSHHARDAYFLVKPLYSGKCTEHLSYSRYVGLLDYKIVFRLDEIGCYMSLRSSLLEFHWSLSIYMRIGVYHLSSKTFYLASVLSTE